MNSDVQETDDPGCDSAVFQDPDNSFAFMSPITLTTGKLAWGSDEFLPHLGSYVKTAPGNKNFNSLAMESLRELVFGRVLIRLS